MTDLLLTWLIAALTGTTGWCLASARHHRRMAEGWRYIEAVTRRRGHQPEDVFIAFVDNDTTDEVRRRELHR